MTEPVKKETPWAKIYRCYLLGLGCNLTVRDVQNLGADDAIMTRGALDFEGKHNEGENSEASK